jgi:hypothetical protein
VKEILPELAHVELIRFVLFDDEAKAVVQHAMAENDLM